MKLVKISTSYGGWPLAQQTPGSSGEWGGCRFVVDEATAEADAWVVLDGLVRDETTRCSPENTLLIVGEPPSVKRAPDEFLGQFAAVHTTDPDSEHPCALLTHPALPWFVGWRTEADGSYSFHLPYDTLAAMPPPEKTGALSVVTSNKTMTEGHRRRLAFVRALAERVDLDVYGRGLRDVADKWEALAPYRYSLALENCSLPHYFTEKLSDCYLSWTYPFYVGCTNAEDYFPAGSFTRLPEDDVEKAAAIIREAIEADVATTARDAMAEARRRVLDEYNVFAVLSRWAATLEDGEPEALTLQPASAFRRRGGLLSRLSRRRR